MDTTARHLRIELKQDILITSLDDQEGIVLDVDAKSYYLINETGLFLLNLLQQNGGQASQATLTNQLSQEYDVDDAEAERDVAEFVRSLGDRCLVSAS